MTIAQTGVNLRFSADTAAASAQVAALERRLESLQNKMGRKIKQAAFDTSGFDVRINSQVRSMDELTKSIQRGNVTYKQFSETLRGTNGLMEYQSKLARSYATSMRTLGNGQMMVGMNVRDVRGVSNALADQAVRLSTASAAGKAYGQTLMNLGKNMAFMGRQAMLSVTAPMALVAGGSAAVFYQYDKQLTTIVKLAGDSSTVFQASAATIRNESMSLAESLSKNFGVAIKESLTLMETFSALGKSGRDLSDATESAARLMKLGDLDPETAIKFTNTMQTVFGKTNEELEHSINLINEMENSTVLSMQDVSEAMPKIGPVVKAMGGDIDQVLVLLEALKRGGIDAVEGANAVKSITGSVFRSTKKLRLMYADMVPGDQWEAMIARNGNNIVKIIGDIGDKMSKLSTAERMKFMYQLGGKEQAARLLQLTSNLAQGNVQVNKVLMKSNEERKQIADKEIADLMASASAQFDVQVQRILSIASSIGSRVLPLVTKGLTGFIDTIKTISSTVSGALDKMGPFGDFLENMGKVALVIAGSFGPALLVISAMGLILGGVLKTVAFGTAMAARSANKLSGGRFALPVFQTASQKAERDAMRQTQAAQAQSVLSTKQLQAAIDKLTASYAAMGVAATGAATRTAGAAATQRATAAQMATNPALMPNRNTTYTPGANTPNTILRSDAARDRMLANNASINRLNSQVGPLTPAGPASTTFMGLGGRGMATDVHTTGIASSERAAQQMERNTQKAQALGTAVGGAAIAFSLLGTMMAGSNAEAQKWVMIIGGSLLVMSMFPGTMGKMVLKAVGGLKLMTAALLSTSAASSAMGTRVVGGLRNIGTSALANIGKIAGIGVAIAAAATLAFITYRALTAQSRAFREENDKIADSVKGWAEVYDFTLLEKGQKRDSTGEAVETPQSRILAMKEDEYLGPLIDRLQRQKDDEVKVRNELYTEAIKLATQGIKPEDIKRNLDELMSAANIDQGLKAKMNIEFTDFSITGPEGSPLAAAAQSKIDDLMGSSDGNTLSKWQQLDYTSFAGAFGTGRSKNELSQKALGDLNNFFTDMENALATASSDPETFKIAVDQWFGKLDQVFEDGLKSFGPDIQKKIEENGGLLNADLSSLREDISSPIGKMSSDEYDLLAYRQQVLIKSTERLKEEYGGIPSMYETAAGAAIMAGNAMDVATNTPQEATKKLKEEIARLGDRWNKLSDDEKASIINSYRASAGYGALEGTMRESAIAAQTLGTNSKKAGDDIAAVGDEALEAQNALQDVEVNWEAEFTINTKTGFGGEVLESTMKMSDYKDALTTVQSDMFDYAANASSEFLSQRMDAIKAEQDAAGKALDAEGKQIEADFKGRSKSLDDRQKQEEKVFSKAQDAEKKQFDKNWEDRMDAEAKIYDDRIKAIEDAQAAEDELERQRQRNSEREAERLRYLANMMNNNIDMNIAIASGDLDQASRLAVNAQQDTADFGRESSDREAGYKKEDDDRGRKTAIELIQDEKEARMDMLEEQKELEREAMEERLAIQKEEFDRKREMEREALDASRQAAQDGLAMRREAMQQEFANKQANETAMQQTNARRMQQELDTLRAFIPRTQAEMIAQKDAIQAIYAKYGIELQIQGDQWSSFIRDSMTNRLEEARIKMSNEAAWNDFGRRVAGGISQGALNMNVDDFNKFLRDGTMPGTRTGATIGDAGSAGRHGGGPIMSRGGYDKYDSRAGIPRNAPLRSDETTILAQQGEYMVKAAAHKRYGTKAMESVNSGRAIIGVRHDGGPIGAVRHDGGPMGEGGMAGIVAAAAYGALASKVALAAGTAMSDAVSQSSYGGGGVFEGNRPTGNAFIDSMMAAAAAGGFPLQMTSGLRFTDGGYHSKGMAADFSNGGTAGTPQMKGFAAFIADNYADDTLQLIHRPFNRNIGQGVGFVGDGNGFYGDGTMAGHRDHVHWAVNKPVDPNKRGSGPSGGGGGASAPSSDEARKKFPQYAGWTTEGINKYRSAAMSRFAPAFMSGDSANAELGAVQTGNKEFYIKEIVDEAKRRNLTKNAAIIALMTAMQESTIRILANPAVPESLKFPNDGMGYDHDSVGIFQQRQAGWGTLAQRMNARASAGLFYNKLASFDYNSMDKGAAAQKVQVSAYPGKYSQWEGASTAQANRYFDNGGLSYGKGFMPKNVIAPERVLSPEMTQSFDTKLIPILQSISGTRGITGYDKIIQALKNDNGQLAELARKAVNAVSGAASQAVRDYNLEFTIQGNVYGVDDLEDKINELTNEAIKRIEAEEILRQRRLKGR